MRVLLALTMLTLVSCATVVQKGPVKEDLDKWEPSSKGPERVIASVTRSGATGPITNSLSVKIYPMFPTLIYNDVT